MNIICCLALLCCCFCLFHNAPVQGKRVAEQKCKEYIDEIADIPKQRTVIPLGFDIRRKNEEYMDNIHHVFHAGGRDAMKVRRGEFVHQALLVKRNNGWNNRISYCGGSLISKRFVLTAAHCGRPTEVRFTTASPRRCKVSGYTKHPKYKLERAYFDIALVELGAEVLFISSPACLWTRDPPSTVVATGYGATEFGGPIMNVLMKVPLEVINRTICEDKFFGYRKLDEGIKDEQLCVGSTEGGNDTCDGDSGGPIQVVSDVNMTTVYYVVGIVSTGYACGIGMTASVYTKVASYVDWIEEIVWPDEWKESQNPVGSAHQFPTQN